MPVLGLVAALSMILFVACSPSQAPPSPGASVVHITERDFHISAPQTVSTGNLLLRVRNEGPDSHEFIIVRMNGKLPLRTDGLTVNEETLQTKNVGVLEPGETGTVRDLALHLSPGNYQFFCNMAGHFMAGMHGRLVVQ
jgi:uncharacterized cupredoxin-like copper-binding protein